MLIISTTDKEFSLCIQSFAPINLRRVPQNYTDICIMINGFNWLIIVTRFRNKILFYVCLFMAGCLNFELNLIT